MQFETLAQIQTHKFVGNHFADSAAFAAIEQFACNCTNSISDRAQALREMGMRGMGLTRAEVDAGQSDCELVSDYISQMD